MIHCNGGLDAFNQVLKDTQELLQDGLSFNGQNLGRKIGCDCLANIFLVMA